MKRVAINELTSDSSLVIGLDSKAETTLGSTLASHLWLWSELALTF